MCAHTQSLQATHMGSKLSAAGHAQAGAAAAWLQVVPGAISQAALLEHPDMPWMQWCAPSQQ